MDVIPDTIPENLPAEQHLRAGDDAGTTTSGVSVTASDPLGGSIAKKHFTVADRQSSPCESRCCPKVVGDWICTCAFFTWVCFWFAVFFYQIVLFTASFR